MRLQDGIHIETNNCRLSLADADALEMCAIHCDFFFVVLYHQLQLLVFRIQYMQCIEQTQSVSAKEYL